MAKSNDDNEYYMQISTPLGKDKISLLGFVAEEGMSQLYSISASMYTLANQIKLSDLVGKSVTISVNSKYKDETLRYFQGIVSHLETKGSGSVIRNKPVEYTYYDAVIVPKAAFMANRKNCRIYQNKSVIDIASDLFSHHKVAFKDMTKGSSPKYEFCVQYEETDLDFLCRLLQQEGIFFFFEHSKKEHILKLVNDVNSYVKCKDSEVMFNTRKGNHSSVTKWSGGLTMVSGAFSQQGYDFKQPKESPKGNSVVSTLPAQNTYEVFDYVGESELNKRAKQTATMRLEALQKDMHKCAGTSDCSQFLVGKLFTFKDHEEKHIVGKTFLLTWIRTSVSSDGDEYTNHFECVPEKTPYRAVALHKKPLINGVQTAVVTGEKGDEILVDKYGRVKVQFHWDREGKNDSSSSCWIRISQNWAGNKWGAFFFPRVGQEVLVDFINGDPDQPIISGAVYNVDLMPPYDLPSKKTQSGIKSRSSKTGGADNFNELRFDDEKGKELFAVQAEKDYEILIKNDSSTKVMNNSTETVTKAQTVEIGETRTIKVKKDDALNVDGACDTTIAKDYTLKLGAGQTVSVAKDDKLDVTGSRSVSITQSHKLSAGTKLTITGGQEISLAAGAASITLKASGEVAIKGTKVTLQGVEVNISGAKIAQKAAIIMLN